MQDFLDDPNADEAWVGWCFTLYYDFWSPELRLDCVKKLKNEMSAFNLYLNNKKLTDEEDAILETKFKDKLPKAEQQLKEGKLKREKKK